MNHPHAIRILHILLLALCVLTVLHLALQHLNLNVFYQQNGQVYELSNRFDFDDEASVPTWFSQFLFLLIGASAAAAAYLQPKLSVRRLWSVIALIAVAFSIDEIATLHERFLQMLHVLFFQDATPGGLANAWLLVVPFVLLIGAWMTWVMIRYLPKRTVVLFVVSGAIFLLGAIGVDLVTSIAERENFLNQGIMVAAEESLELFGIIFALYAILDYIERHHHKALGSALQKLKSSGRDNDSK